ncbi:hypothetical protein ES703_93824 [subsurface metagenome]
MTYVENLFCVEGLYDLSGNRVCSENFVIVVFAVNKSGFFPDNSIWPLVFVEPDEAVYNEYAGLAVVDCSAEVFIFPEHFAVFGGEAIDTTGDEMVHV